MKIRVDQKKCQLFPKNSIFNFFHSLGRKKRCLFGKEIVIPASWDNTELSRKGLQFERINARIMVDGHIFISGAVRKKAETDHCDLNAIEVHCDIINSQGELLFPVKDPVPKNLELNPYQPFLMTVYHAGRFFDPEQIESVMLYCQFAEPVKREFRE